MKNSQPAGVELMVCTHGMHTREAMYRAIHTREAYTAGYIHPGDTSPGYISLPGTPLLGIYPSLGNPAVGTPRG